MLIKRYTTGATVEINNLGLDRVNPQRMILIGYDSTNKETHEVELTSDELEMIGQYWERNKKRNEGKKT